jgi:hypothetical protein
MLFASCALKLVLGIPPLSIRVVWWRKRDSMVDLGGNEAVPASPGTAMVPFTPSSPRAGLQFAVEEAHQKEHHCQKTGQGHDSDHHIGYLDIPRSAPILD